MDVLKAHGAEENTLVLFMGDNAIAFPHGNSPFTLAAHRAGRLRPEHERAYFQRPRPVIELFDLLQDPDELTNLAGRPETAAAQQELLEALQEKMIIDFDYLPPPFAN